MRQRIILTKEEMREYQRMWALANRDKIRAAQKRWHVRNPDNIRKNANRRYHANPEMYIRKVQEWRRKHNYGSTNHLARSLSDPTYRLRRALRRRLYALVKFNQKSESAFTLLGCSIEDFWLYLESKFEQGMTRSNYGEVWHIDHIMPCAIFDMSKPEHQKRCFHFSNLQPLFVQDNYKKHSRVLDDQFNLI